MRDKRVVITGGAGFIGSNLAEKLVGSNSVIIIDDLSTGKKGNIASLLKKDNVEFTQGSILDLKLLQKSFRGIDFVFHQAALPSVPRSIEDPRASNDANITGTLNVLLAARDNKVKKVVYASSSSVYGDTPTLPKSEDMSPNPQSPYALTMENGESGNIYIPSQKTIVLIDLAKAVIDLYGNSATKQKICGARAGEKLHEILFTEGEKVISSLDSNCSQNSPRLSVDKIKDWLME